MLRLADNLQQIAARHHDASGAPLVLHCGLDVGPLVGKMVGQTKAFWCLFGSPINLASRLAGVAVRAGAKTGPTEEEAGQARGEAAHSVHSRTSKKETETEADTAGAVPVEAHTGVVCSANVLQRLEVTAAAATDEEVPRLECMR